MDMDMEYEGYVHKSMSIVCIDFPMNTEVSATAQTNSRNGVV